MVRIRATRESDGNTYWSMTNTTTVQQGIVTLKSEGSMSKELIANLRGENLDCNCAAYSRSECSCSTNWPESFCKEAADALEEAERIIEAQRTLYQNAVSVANKLEAAEARIDELIAAIAEHVTVRSDYYRKLAIAREALQKCVDMPRSHEAHRVSVQALAQLGEPCRD